MAVIRSVAVAVILAVASSVPIASALDAPRCCACLEGEFAQTSGGNRTASSALFCTSAGNLDTSRDRCKELSGSLVCLADGNSNSSCRGELAEEGIFCPTSGAPTASAASLLALAVVLGAGGALFLRRQPVEVGK